MNRMDLARLIDEHRRRIIDQESTTKFDQGATPLTVGGNGLPRASSGLPVSLGFTSSSLGLSTSTLPSATPTTLSDYAALHQRLLLEEQMRRDLLAQAWIGAQLQQASQPQSGSVSDLLEKLGLLPGGSAPSVKQLAESSSSLPEPPFKKPRLEVASKPPPTSAPEIVINLSKKEKKSSFPMPSLSGKDEPVPVKKLTSFNKTWSRLAENAGFQDPEQKEEFVAEFFARNLYKNYSDSLYKKVNGLHSSPSRTEKKRKPHKSLKPVA